MDFPAQVRNFLVLVLIEAPVNEAVEIMVQTDEILMLGYPVQKIFVPPPVREEFCETIDGILVHGLEVGIVLGYSDI